MFDTAKVLFLDIDGVLNSQRSCYAFDGFPHSFSADDMKMFDHVAIALVRKVCRKTGCAVVMSSTWRKEFSASEFAVALGLPVISRTPVLNRPRGEEIADYLRHNVNVKRYAIVDDDSDMLPEQRRFFVQTDFRLGLTDDDACRLIEILGERQS